GTAALRQRDVPAAIDLLDRALTLAPPGARATAAVRPSDALMLSGDTRRAVDVVTADPDRLCMVQRQILAVRLGQPAVALDTLRADLAIDAYAWCRFEQLRMLLHLRD